MTRNRLMFGVCAALLTVSMAPVANAGQVVADSKKVVAEPEEAKSLCDTIFAIPTLYKDKENPYIQKVAFIGRYQWQYHYLDSNQGDEDDGETRRFRLGMAVDFLKQFKFSFNFNLNVEDDAERFVDDLEDATLAWEPNKTFTLSAGKMKAPITHDWRTSSTKILAFERSLLVSQVVPNKAGGVLASYKGENGLLLEGGVYSGSTDEDWNYPTFDGGAMAYASVGYKAKDFGTVRGEYLYVDQNDESNLNKSYDNIFSAWYENEWDKLGLVVNGIYATGAGEKGDVYGVILMPTYKITDYLQLVTRYQYAGSDSPDGIRLGSRYEREAPDLITSYGDDYHAVYAGLNWYICDHNLKFMAGVEYATMDQSTGDNFESVTYLGGVRLFF